MNLLEHYITNITKEERIEGEDFVAYKMIADVNCYGNIQKQKAFILTEYDYNSVKTKGYYLG